MHKVFINIDNVSKLFCKSMKSGIYYGLIDLLSAIIGVTRDGKTLRENEFFALKNISLDFIPGKVVGIVGANGSGKSTLLRLIAGIYEPDAGTVSVCGSLVSFLSAGTGFHPHFTVRENIVLNGILLGMKESQVRRNMDKILDIADLKKNADTPFGMLSPGMNIRISFAIVIVAKPQILLIDEVLSVADENFRKKSIEAIKEISKNSIVIFVSHNREMIEALCDSLIVMDKGDVVFQSDSLKDGLEYYYG